MDKELTKEARKIQVGGYRRDRGGKKEVQGWAIVDKEDYEWLNQWRWSMQKEGHVSRRANKKIYWMHREIMKRVHGLNCYKEKDHTDHINRNPLDNRKENLRVCTNSENQLNRKDIQINNKSGQKGVYWNKKRKKWYSRIKIKGDMKWLGGYDDKALAIKAREEAELSLLPKE